MNEIVINDFSGPLDLLLHLIKESKVDIFDVNIVEITDKYLDFLNKMEEKNLDVASEYLVMASELLEIKSRLLLPKQKLEDSEEEEIDPKEELINRLVEYQKYKDAKDSLKKLEELRLEIYTKSPESVKEYLDQDEHLSSDIKLDDLLLAFKKFLERKEAEKPLNTKVTRRGITVIQRRKEIKKILSEKKRVNFFDLFNEFTKEYVVVTFLTILEMAKDNALVIKQENNFDDIICEAPNE